MTGDQLAMLGLAFTVIVAVAAMIWRQAQYEATTTSDIKEVVKDVTDHEARIRALEGQPPLSVRRREA